MAETSLGKGRELIAGNISTRQLDLAADTYYIGMGLKYAGAVAVTQAGTGNGTLTAVIADESVVPDVYTLKFTAALIADLTNAAGVVLAQGLTFGNGAATTLTVGGLTFTVTDGSTAFVATDTLIATITVGTYAYTTGAPDAIYNGSAGRVLSSVGVDDCITNGEISATGLKDDAGDAITLTADDVAAYKAKSFFVKEN